MSFTLLGSRFSVRVQVRATHAAMVVLLVCVGVRTAGAQVALVDAVKSGDTARVRALIDTRVDVNATQADGTTALHWAVDLDRPEVVQMLIRAGANVKTANRYGATPLWLASVNGNPKTIAMLL